MAEKIYIGKAPEDTSAEVGKCFHTKIGEVIPHCAWKWCPNYIKTAHSGGWMTCDCRRR